MGLQSATLKKRAWLCITRLAALEIYSKHAGRNFRVPYTGNHGVILVIIQLDAQKFTDHFKVIYLLIGKIL